MRNYEVLFIIDPMTDEEQKNKLIDTVKEIINANGEAGEADIWGNRKLAYEIDKKNEGFYVLIPFKGETELPKELNRRLRISDKIMRHIIVCQDEK